MSRYVVTGGAGFIGGHLVKRLVQEGNRVAVVDNLSTGRIENIDPKVEFIQGDVSNPADVAKLPRDHVEGVFHLAAQSSGEISFEDPSADFKTNVGGTFNMLEWCRRSGVHRFIFTSTMGVYGWEGEDPVPESAPCLPKSFYGMGKLAAEQYVRFFAKFGIRTTVVRPFNVYGPAQNLSNLKQGMASIYMSYLLKGEPILVRGNLDRFRDQTYVEDVVDAMVRCLWEEKSVGQAYNVATGSKTTVRDLIRTMIQVAGLDPDKYPVTEAEGTPGDLFGCYADVTKARVELGWEHRYDLKKGLKIMYESYRDSKAGR